MVFEIYYFFRAEKIFVLKILQAPLIGIELCPPPLRKSDLNFHLFIF